MATSKSVHATVLDAALNYVKTKITNVYVISTTLNIESWSVISNNYLASTTMNSALNLFTLSAGGSGGGRKLTVPAMVDMDIWGFGSANGVALVDSTGEGDAKVLYVTSCTAKVLTSGDKVNIPTWDIQLTDPQ